MRGKSRFLFPKALRRVRISGRLATTHFGLRNSRQFVLQFADGRIDFDRIVGMIDWGRSDTSLAAP
jgi:alkylation response protein AidB-like acyl-CoA dehydrogenase